MAFFFDLLKSISETHIYNYNEICMSLLYFILSFLANPEKPLYFCKFERYIVFSVRQYQRYYTRTKDYDER